MGIAVQSKGEPTGIRAGVGKLFSAMGHLDI